jgi:hypothetical protein
MIVTCPGPHRRKGGCPVLAGGTCPIHWDADLAVVFESEDHEGPHAPCHEALGIPVLTLTGGSDAPMEPADDGATMGLERPEPRRSAPSTPWPARHYVLRVSAGHRRVGRPMGSHTERAGHFQFARCSASEAGHSRSRLWLLVATSGL